MFICNHCPYVQAIINFLVDDAKYLESKGIKSAAIMSNDTQSYPEDSFENMKKFAKENNFSFPYLYDESQEIAKKAVDFINKQNKGWWIRFSKVN